MDKKRRETKSVEILDLKDESKNLPDEIAVKTNYVEDEGVTYAEYLLLPKYGEGYIHHLQVYDFEVFINRFKLHSDLVIYKSKGRDDCYAQLSFLLGGEKIISVEGHEDIFYESQESYLVNIKEYKGYYRISRDKLFNEIKINLSQSFFDKYGFNGNNFLKKIYDTDLIMPITVDLQNSLNALDKRKLKGNALKLYLEAKVLEILAFQLDNYKNASSKSIRINDENKTVKKLYLVRQILKNNLHRNYSIKQLSREVGLNDYLLKKEFKRVFGCSINEYKTSEKMNKAMELLRFTQAPVYQIAEEVGYKNSTHFTAAFKRFMGKAPKKYRDSL
ncbi:helix-turn-helix transcriptional regulator [Abyssalbus ytuae]|uniref:AraC family transcriptional regulator n=1 Tax=Abyssalbus ytuae TaxID=2926907 RepID=A0A9E6ZLL1_9FLAO|nr:AraC family transcriptional regulator [Abyssalbus ytuae]UOB16520.1 AraC family transcriptional regulator [Abyssalbus ytuae]